MIVKRPRGEQNGVGVLGDGQLSLMLAQAAARLGIALQRTGASPRHAPELSWKMSAQRLAQDYDIITWERDDIPHEQLQSIADRLRPGLQVMQQIQDRLTQKQLLQRLDVPVAAWLGAADESALQSVLDTLDFPMVVKARQGGYDGRGQRIVKDRRELVEALSAFSETGSIVEALISFDDECAVQLSRDQHGQCVLYPLTLTVQKQGQLSWALAPHPMHESLQQQARDCAVKIAEALDYTGSMAVEFFRCGERLLVNEISPRVHNSGHWTIEGCSTDQFENHLLAASGAAVREPCLQSLCLMINAIGSMSPQAQLLQHDWFYVHDYHKEPRPRRKVGHYTLTASDMDQMRSRFEQLQHIWTNDVSDIAAYLQNH